MIGYSLTLPLGPSINNYHGMRGHNRYVKPEGLQFQKEVALAVKQSKMPTLTGRVCVIVRVFPKDRRVQDIDNRIKVLADSLQKAGAFENDSQIDEWQVTRGPIVQGGRIEVMVGELPCQK